MSNPINVYSIPELRQALDEDLPIELGKLGFNENYVLSDLKLYIGYSISIVAASSFLIDKKFEYSDMIIYQKGLVFAYIVLSVVFWWFTKNVKKDIVYKGKNVKEQVEVIIRSKFEKNEPIYRLTIEKINVISSKTTTTSANLPVNEVFNEAGYLQKNLFFSWLKDQLQLDTKKDL